MATAKRFEELEVWQSAKTLAVLVYKTTEKDGLKKDYGLKDQLRRASVSIVSNIAEGFERNGNKEFIQFLSLAKGSAGELRAQLHIAKEVGYITSEEFEFIINETSTVSKMLFGLLNYLKYTEMKGSKFVREDFEAYSINDSET